MLSAAWKKNDDEFSASFFPMVPYSNFILTAQDVTEKAVSLIRKPRISVFVNNWSIIPYIFTPLFLKQCGEYSNNMEKQKHQR